MTDHPIRYRLHRPAVPGRLRRRRQMVTQKCPERSPNAQHSTPPVDPKRCCTPGRSHPSPNPPTSTATSPTPRYPSSRPAVAGMERHQRHPRPRPQRSHRTLRRLRRSPGRQRRHRDLTRYRRGGFLRPYLLVTTPQAGSSRRSTAQHPRTSTRSPLHPATCGATPTTTTVDAPSPPPPPTPTATAPEQRTPPHRPTWAYDSADRPTTGVNGVGSTPTTPWVADHRPSADAPTSAAGNISLGYFDDDLPRVVTQNGTPPTFTLDSANRRLQADTATGSQTPRTVRHYSDGETTILDRVHRRAGADQHDQVRRIHRGDLGHPSNRRISCPVLGQPARRRRHHRSRWTPPGVQHTHFSDHRRWSDYTNSAPPATPPRQQRRPGLPDMDGSAPNNALPPTKPLASPSWAIGLYNAITARFTSLDPNPGGQRHHLHVPADPIDQFDFDGRHWSWRKSWRSGSGSGQSARDGFRTSQLDWV